MIAFDPDFGFIKHKSWSLHDFEKNGFFTFSGQSYFLLTLYQYLVYILTSPLILWSFQLICGTSFNFQNFFPLHRSFFILHVHVLANKKLMYLKIFWTGMVLVLVLTEASKSKKKDWKFSPKIKIMTKLVQNLFGYSSLKTVGICTLWGENEHQIYNFQLSVLGIL